MVSLNFKSDQVPPELLDRLRHQIGRRLRPAGTGGHQYNGHGVNLALGSSLYINAHVLDDPAWKARLAALWTVVKGTALGTEDTLDERTRRDVLNMDYPLTRLAEIGFEVDVDGAAREVARVLPGAVSEGEVHRIGIGHPWIESARLSWENQPGGRWTGTQLDYAAEFDFKAQREDLDRCLAPGFGEPTRTVGDHLAGDVTLDYPARGEIPRIHVTRGLILIFTPRDGGAPPSAEGFARVIEALDRCGG
jgi:hypothetical protein